MNIAVYQVISIIISISLFYLLIRRYVKGRLTAVELLVSGVLLFMLFLAATFPNAFSNKLAQILGIKSNINAVLFGGILVSLWLNFRLYIMLRKLSRRINALVSELSIKKIDEKK